MYAVRAYAGTEQEPSGRPKSNAASASVPSSADAGDDDWALSEDDGADDEVTLDEEELAALADGVNVKVSSVLRSRDCPYLACNDALTVFTPSQRRPIEALVCKCLGSPPEHEVFSLPQ